MVYSLGVFHARTGGGGNAVGKGLNCADGFMRPRRPWLQWLVSSCSSDVWVSSLQSSTKILMPTPSSGSISTSTPFLPMSSCSNCSFFRAIIRSSARGVLLGGSSRICSQPTGGEPGGDMRKFFSSAGGRRRFGLSSCSRGVGSARNTRRTTGRLKK